MAAKAVGIYLDLAYRGWEGIAPTVPPVAGPLAQSPPNSIAYGNTTIPTVVEGQPSITTVYRDSTVDFFDLISFFFGCSLGLRNNEIAKPQECEVSHSRSLDVVRGNRVSDIDL